MPSGTVHANQKGRFWSRPRNFLANRKLAGFLEHASYSDLLGMPGENAAKPSVERVNAETLQNRSGPFALVIGGQSEHVPQSALHQGFRMRQDVGHREIAQLKVKRVNVLKQPGPGQARRQRSYIGASWL